MSSSFHQSDQELCDVTSSALYNTRSTVSNLRTHWVHEVNPLLVAQVRKVLAGDISTQTSELTVAIIYIHIQLKNSIYKSKSHKICAHS